MSFRVFFLCLSLCLFVQPVLAGEPLSFRNQVKGVRESSVLDFLKTQKGFNPDLAYTIAAIDLNGDGVDEWIFRQEASPSCNAQADCLYFILGLSEKMPILLSHLKARKIGIADEKLYGVRKLFVYNDKNNDFAYQNYVWKPSEGTFGPE